MAIHSLFCREREAIERQRASVAPLDNVKTVAERAASAWALAAVRAERLEAAARLRLAATRRTDDEARQLSENPDRGIVM